MRKAIEYMQLFEEGGKTFDGLRSVMNGLISDTKELCRARKVKTDMAVFSVFIEIDQKFTAFKKKAAFMVDGSPIPADAFRRELKANSPDLFERWNRHMGGSLIID